MRIIKKENEIIGKLLEEQSITQNDIVRFATWCAAVAAANGYILLINVLTRELICLETGESTFLA